MYVGAYETSGFKSFVFGFFPAIRFFPHVYSRYAFFFFVITAVCMLFPIKLLWPRNKSSYYQAGESQIRLVVFTP